MTGSTLNRHTWLFLLALSMLTFWGHDAISYGLLLLAVIAQGSFREFGRTMVNSSAIFCFIAFIIIYGSWKMAVGDIPRLRAILVWGQFTVLTTLMAFVKNKSEMLQSTGLLMTIMFILDFATNVLLICGFDIPWSEVPPVRDGETYARLGGFFNNHLYSGSITTYFIFYYLSVERKRRSIPFKLLFLFSFINLIFIGSYRFYSILILVAFIKFFPSWRRGDRLSASILIFSALMTFSTLATPWLGSNDWRITIWVKSFVSMIDNPLGQGLQSPEIGLIRRWDAQGLFDAGITESGMLLCGISFGIIGVLWLLWVYISAFRSTKRDTPQLAIYCLFYTFYSLCFSSFLENPLDIVINALAIYLISNRRHES